MRYRVKLVVQPDPVKYGMPGETVVMSSRYDIQCFWLDAENRDEAHKIFTRQVHPDPPEGELINIEIEPDEGYVSR